MKPAARWKAAEAEVRAASALLGDAAVEPSTAAVHIIRAWEALAHLRDEDDATGLEWLPAGERDEAAAGLAHVTRYEVGALASKEVDAGGIAVQVRALSVALRRAGAEFADAPSKRWRMRLAIAGLIAVPAVVGLALTFPDFREGPWRGTYYPAQDFTGDPIVQRDGDINFDFAEGAPRPELPVDGFSVRWETCLHLEEPRSVAFQLVSDDGSRLYVDDELVIDNWGMHPKFARGGTVELEPGVHPVRVDYFDALAHASITLSASLRGEVPTALPARVLAHPPCD